MYAILLFAFSLLLGPAQRRGPSLKMGSVCLSHFFGWGGGSTSCLMLIGWRAVDMSSTSSGEERP